MYINPINRWEKDQEIIEFIRQNAFGILISQVNQRSHGTHLPFVLDQNPKGEALLSGHVARANPQWKSIPDQSEVLVIFQGPHAYISSSWYNHENVPTWNYLAVHVYGKIRIIEGEELLIHLRKLIDNYETGRDPRVHLEGMSETYLQSQIRALVGFEILISDVHASAKLSQNRDQINYQNIVSKLEHSGNEMDRAIASEMKKIRKNDFLPNSE